MLTARSAQLNRFIVRGILSFGRTIRVPRHLPLVPEYGPQE
jgi:hypothetical protein